MVESTAEICRKYVNPESCMRATTCSFVTGCSVGPATPDGGYGRIRPVSIPRRNQQHVGLVVFRAASGRDTGARRRRRQLLGIVEGKVGDAADTKTHGRQGCAIRGTHGAQHDLVARRNLEVGRQRPADQQCRPHALRRGFKVLTGQDRPGAAASRIDAHQRQRDRASPRTRNFSVGHQDGCDFRDLRQGRKLSGDRRGVRQPRSAERRRFSGHHPNIESHAVEQIAERHDQAARKQQHVEQQRADCGNPEDAERRPSRLAGEASGREHQRFHRRKHSATEERPGRHHDGEDAEGNGQRHGSQRDERRDSDEDQRGIVPPLKKPVDAALKRGARAGCRKERPPPR